jgi:hypothetical protein
MTNLREDQGLDASPRHVCDHAERAGHLNQHARPRLLADIVQDMKVSHKFSAGNRTHVGFKFSVGKRMYVSFKVSVENTMQMVFKFSVENIMQMGLKFSYHGNRGKWCPSAVLRIP